MLHFLVRYVEKNFYERIDSKSMLEHSIPERIHISVIYVTLIFDWPGALKQHVRSTHLNVTFKCDHCEKTFRSKNGLNSHMKSIHLKSFACDVCQKCFNSEPNLRRHKASEHNLDALYKCEPCGKAYAWKDSLDYHIRSIHLKEEYACKYCTLTYKGQGSLRNHVQAVHSSQDPFQCKQCDKKFKSRTGLQRHIQSIHMGVKHDCNFCKSSFNNKSHLNRHIKSIHSPNPPR